MAKTKDTATDSSEDKPIEEKGKEEQPEQAQNVKSSVGGSEEQGQTQAGVSRDNYFQVRLMTRDLITALFCNPKLENFIQGSPFDHHMIDNKISIGEHLADHCWNIATEYQKRLNELCEADYQKRKAQAEDLKTDPA